MARDIILNLAISLDGFICDEDGGFAWISGQGDVRRHGGPLRLRRLPGILRHHRYGSKGL